MVYKVTLNGKVYEVEVEKGEAIIKSEYEAALPSQNIVVAKEEKVETVQNANPSNGGSSDAIKAPMPGNINAVKVTSGQSVKKGDVLIILEAMKMENEIVAPKDGKVGQVFVQKGATVETGTALIEVL